MRKLMLLALVVLVVAAFAPAPASAGTKLEVTIPTVGILTPDGTFTVEGEAAEFMCDSGDYSATNTRIWNVKDERFKISQDNVFTCDSGESFVLELRNTIGVPGKGTWKLKDSTGFDPAPKGKGKILAGEFGEIFEGLLKFK